MNNYKSHPISYYFDFKQDELLIINHYYLIKNKIKKLESKKIFTQEYFELLEKQEILYLKYQDIEDDLCKKYNLLNYTIKTHLQFLNICKLYDSALNDSKSYLEDIFIIEDKIFKLEQQLKYIKEDYEIFIIKKELEILNLELLNTHEEFELAQDEVYEYKILFDKHIDLFNKI